jgi:hypothetical protein
MVLLERRVLGYVHISPIFILFLSLLVWVLIPYFRGFISFEMFSKFVILTLYSQCIFFDSYVCCKHKDIFTLKHRTA